SDIAQPTPYNTYLIDGLPPGPIANPGRGAIEAAANPARTKELYFVADGTGGHAFAETYEQHLKNVARLRVIEHDQRGEAPSQDSSSAARRAPASPAPISRAKRSASGSPKAAGTSAQ
ncbi:MAG TPA: endolytic transglycosylase MltG, partial [Xanthobacteraceae bacterium]